MDKKILEKTDTAELSVKVEKAPRLKTGLKGARKAVVRFGKKVFKLAPRHVTDPAVATALAEKGADAIDRVDGMRATLGV